MEHVNYEERYPTVVTQENTPNNYPDHSRPQTNASSSPAYSEKFLVDSKKQAGVHVYPEVAGKDVPLQTFYPNAIAPNEERNAFLPPPPLRRYCGMSKKAFLIVLGVAALVVVGVVAGAIGGALGSRKSSKDSTTSIPSCTGSQCSSTATVTTGGSQTGTPVTAGSATSATGSSGPTSSTSLDTTASIGSIAASTVQDSANKVYVHLYYQQGSNIAYRTYPGKGSFAAAQALPLKITPKTGTAIAASEFLDATSNYMLVVYQDASNNIICANFTSSIGADSLTLTESTQIAAGTTAHPSSSLALVYLGADGGTWRTYYQATNGTLLELVGTTKAWKAGAVLSAAVAVGGSPIALSMVKAPQVNIFYVDSSTSNIFSISYSGGWQTPSQLTTAAMTKWNGTDTSLAAIQESEPEYLRTYYIGTDSEIHEFYGNPGEAFSPKSDQSPHWDVLDTQGPGAIAGIGWSDQVRLYYVSGGKVVQTALSNATWGSATTF